MAHVLHHNKKTEKLNNEQKKLWTYIYHHKNWNQQLSIRSLRIFGANLGVGFKRGFKDEGEQNGSTNAKLSTTYSQIWDFVVP